MADSALVITLLGDLLLPPLLHIVLHAGGVGLEEKIDDTVVSDFAHYLI